MNKKHVRTCIQETLEEMYGASMVSVSEDQQQLTVAVDEKKAIVDLESYVCSCIRHDFIHLIVCRK